MYERAGVPANVRTLTVNRQLHYFCQNAMCSRTLRSNAYCANPVIRCDLGR
jgi:hypothetical protein